MALEWLPCSCCSLLGQRVTNSGQEPQVLALPSLCP